MLTTSTRLKIQHILNRLSNGNPVTLEERLYINKYAKTNQNVSNWLKEATRIQRKQDIYHPIDELLNGLNLCSPEPHSTYDPNQDDIGEWFSGSPSWIRRS